MESRNALINSMSDEIKLIVDMLSKQDEERRLQIGITEDIYNIFIMEDYWPDNMEQSGIIVNRDIIYRYHPIGNVDIRETITSFCDNIYVQNYSGFDQAGGINTLFPGTTKKLYYFPGSIPYIIGEASFAFASI